MNHNETISLFEKMREVLILTETQRGYDAKQWRACVNLWQGIFARDEFSHVCRGSDVHPQRRQMVAIPRRDR